ncbi:hypothetical protein AU195_18945 [Mycobacterium sp. IS-1496]|uniref:DUF1801 domain-containing protein n=1 Tax=Mycobacterium sp. IS-1496 TaxID=1772284 RepID=UPI000741506D|nr:DUF1801 domain-containing protein [Mycobacterium sp. IS-1496]KUI37179.1 hypothetical protein AU195_18945 [Mycobacterium sp. IS-1496]
MTVANKDDKNLHQVLDKIAAMDEPRRGVMQRLHDVIVSAAPELKPRIWYGMPGYAKSASSPVLIFFRNDDVMTLGVSEKATLKSAGGKDGQLIPAARYFDGLDDVTERRVVEIVRAAIE